MKKVTGFFLLALLVGIFGFSAWQLYGIQTDYAAGDSSYAELAPYIRFDVTVPTIDVSTPTEPGGTEPDQTLWPQVDFEALAQINPDVVGWLHIEGTRISYPVVQGAGNDYYLKHLFDGTYNRAGCLFLDAGAAADLSGQNQVIYGHHMKNGSMFYDLMNYKEQAFYDEHPQALLLTPQGNYRVLFFSGYVSDTASGAWDTEFSPEDYEAWLLELVQKSCFASGTVPTAQDRVLTLSTCTYEFSNARFVLHGILLPEEGNGG